MALTINTSRFEYVHRRKPSGNGAWAFGIEVWEQRADGRMLTEKTIWTPSDMQSYREACAWAKRVARNAHDMQDGIIHVLP